MSTTRYQLGEKRMITTGIHISNAVLAKLASAIADLHRKTADMSMADWRKAYRERSGPTLGCFVYVDFTASGTVKGFTARQIEKSREKFREQGFETDVPMLGPSRFAAKFLARDCAEFLIRREITGRNKANQREFVGLTDDELSVAAGELLPPNGRFALMGISCGSLSEKLRQRLIEEELEVRGNESNHQRMKAMAENVDYLAACSKIVAVQSAAAQDWRRKNEAFRSFTIQLNHDFDNRSEADRTVIAYRDARGWQI
ncbi:hypothetical protein PXK58_01990 [Phaeobacter gallaeciensis]|uniref:hypothetical protein n=1 Tax=Phaeobacter gallaeciensis TaxID=60890 RepID=UPI002380B0B7|nr:hypothetical protein [Phaeobacter gallaeciensis]MDE4272739.1 hypothetical protein [Phaeobacter gallaeciensis]MDE4298308.1 hypothetical protein [Phaeobacter gallaeciensis]MDE5183496.1 hypothetical protein [Phaeobacter gallaeciensis]